MSERQHDVIFGRRGLQLEIERAAEALAQRQAPGPVHPAAEGGMDHQLHAAGFVEEALEHDRIERRQGTERRASRARDTGRAAKRGRRCAADRPSPVSQSTRRARRLRAEALLDLLAAGARRLCGTARRCARAPRPARMESRAAGRAHPRRAPCRARPAGFDTRYCPAGTHRPAGSRPQSPH